MKKIYSIITCLILLFVRQNAVAQCNVDTTVNGFYGFNDPNSPTTIFTGVLCADIDSVGTTGVQGYYDGDGYLISLISGTQVIFETSECTGFDVSLTVVDSNNVVIPGAYSASACPNTLSFTAPYDGVFAVVMNLGGVCAGGGDTLIGQVHVKIDPASTPPPCPPQGVFVNDTICGAIALTVDGAYETADNTNSFPSDPLDATVVNGGFACSAPNNTMWYSYTPAANVDSVYLVMASDLSTGLDAWVGYFMADDISDPCNNSLTYMDCLVGSGPFAGADTVSVLLTNLIGGTTYYFMVDGFAGAVGTFSLGLTSNDIFTSISSIKNRNFTVYPNPASTVLFIENKESATNATVNVINTMGQVIINKSFNNMMNERLDIANLETGLYTVRVSTDKGVTDSKIMVIK